MSLTGYVSDILITSEGGEREEGGGDGVITWLWLYTIFTSSLEPLLKMKQVLP